MSSEKGVRLSGKTVSSVMSVLLVTSILVLAVKIQPVRAGGTIYIRADGSIDPPTAPISTLDNVTYTLTGNITNTDTYAHALIVIIRNNTIVDGAGYTLQSSQLPSFFDIGITLFQVTNVTVENMQIRDFSSFGIRSDTSSNNTIVENNLTNCWPGIALYYSLNTTVSGNNIVNCSEGIKLDFSSGNSLSGNTFTDAGLEVSLSYRNLVENNTVNGKPLVYLEDVINSSVSDAGQVLLVRCDSILVENLSLCRTTVGVELCETKDTIICGNNITNDLLGILLDSSSANSLSENSITANDYAGIFLFSSPNNEIYHNSFVNNEHQVVCYDDLYNVWDAGYPSGGNYWSDYSGIDDCSGPEQNVLGNDGIGDTAYSIDANNTDSYPLMVPFGTSYSSYDWPMFHRDPSHTGCTKDSLSLPLRLKWNTTLTDLEDPTIYCSPVARGDYLYVGGKGRFYALNASSGKILWNVSMTDWICGSPAVSGGLVYVGSDKLYSFDARNGSLVWSYMESSTSDAFIYCSPTIAYGNVYVTGGYAVSALREDTGELVWSYRAGDVFYVNSPAVSYGVVYVGSFDYNVYALDAFNGSVIWKSPTPGFLDCSPSINDGIVYVAGHFGGNSGVNGPGMLYALNASDGTQLWNRTFGRPVFGGTPAVVSGVVYVGNADGNFYALNGSNGEIIWKKDFLASMSFSSPAFVNNVLLVAVNTLRTLYAVNAADGEVFWNCTVRGLIDDSPAVAGKTLYFGDTNATVYAYESNPTFHVILGDINGDFKVSLADLVILAQAYGSKPGDSNWNPNADVDGNGAVGLSDLVILAQHYGQHYP